MIEKGITLTLEDDKEYVVADTFDENGTKYIYLIDINDNTNIKFGKIENDEIVTLTDPDELEMVILKVNEDLHQN